MHLNLQRVTMMNNCALDGPSIRLDQADVRVDNTQLVAPVSTRFEGGQWHAILGPNGGGKSTLLKMLMGLMPHHGFVNIDWPKGEKGRIGYGIVQQNQGALQQTLQLIHHSATNNQSTNIETSP